MGCDLPGPAPRTARLYRLLADHPGPDSTVESAAALAGYDVEQAEDALLELVRASLLTQDEAGGRFRLHDLIRLHARGWAQAEPDGADQEAALLRLARWYRRQAERADRAAKGDRLRIAQALTVDQAPGPDLPFSTTAEAVRWLEEERQALFALVRRAAQAGHHELAWATAEPLDVLFESHRHYADCIDAFDYAVQAADQDAGSGASREESSDGEQDADNRRQQARAWLRCLLARPLWELGQFERARRILDEAFAAAEACGYQRLQAAVWERGGKLHQARVNSPAPQATSLARRPNSPTPRPTSPARWPSTRRSDIRVA